MRGELLRRLLENPLRFFGNAFHKALVGPWLYRAGGGYDAARYWRDRLSKYGMSLRGVGDEGLSEASNQALYRASAGTFLELCRLAGADLSRLDVCEIGVGSGFFTGLLQEAGVVRYRGTDITDALFTELRRRFPAYRFSLADVTAAAIEGSYHLIVMMDVVEHIVEETKLDAALRHIENALLPGGVLVLSGLWERRGRGLFYLRRWTPEDIEQRLAGFRFRGPLPFRNNLALAARKPAGEGD